MFKLETLVDVVALVAAGKRERAVLWQDASANWHPMSSRELLARVYAVANAFAAWGIVKGDRIALLAENRWEWPVVDFATLVLGAVDVPIYPTLTAGQTASLLIDSGARIAVVSTEAQYRKVASIRRPDATRARRCHGPDRRPGSLAYRDRVLVFAPGCRRCHIRGGFRALATRFCGEAAGSGYPHLHLGHYRRAQGRHAHPRQHRL
jgi:long-subunit acyl-CoA synthetase (AMP-forming)